MIGLSGDSGSKFKAWVRALFLKLLINMLSFDFLKCSVTFFFRFWCLNVDVCVCPCFRPWWTSVVGLHVKTKVLAFRKKHSPGACVRLDGLVLTVTCPMSPVRLRPPTEVSCAPQTQGSVHKVLTDQQHFRANIVIMGGEGREDRSGWRRLWRKGPKQKVKGQRNSPRGSKKKGIWSERKAYSTFRACLFLI